MTELDEHRGVAVAPVPTPRGANPTSAASPTSAADPISAAAPTSAAHPTSRSDLTGGPSSTRRGLLLGVGALGAAGVLAACGDDGEEPSEGPDNGGPAAGTSIKKSEVPEGGGAIFKEQNVVVTQPEAGTFKAFGATCTHMQCVVATISEGKINCTCHQSQFNITDGSVARGPATRPLIEKKVTESGDTLTIT
jgi:Rieske Fe-S protein